MKIANLSILLLLFSSVTFALPGDEQLTGDKRTACEIILCLSSGTRPSECNAPIRKYFSIQVFHHGSFSPSRTAKARKNFLKLCPASSSDNKMESLVDVLSNMNNLSLCTANNLNNTIDRRGNRYRTTARLPEYCSVLSSHDYTDVKLPKYTCNKEFYDKADWKRGYILLSNNGRPINSVIINNRNSKNIIKNATKIPIQKICWVD